MISEPRLLFLHSQHIVLALQACTNWIPIPVSRCYFSDQTLPVMLHIERQFCSPCGPERYPAGAKSKPGHEYPGAVIAEKE